MTNLKAPRLTMEFTGPPENECFVKLENGTKIARREGGKWLPLHPNWVVTQKGDELIVDFNPDVNN